MTQDHSILYLLKKLSCSEDSDFSFRVHLYYSNVETVGTVPRTSCFNIKKYWWVRVLRSSNNVYQVTPEQSCPANTEQGMTALEWYQVK